MLYTEDDTFLRLTRTSFADMKAMVDKVVWNKKVTMADIEQLLRNNGWTLDSYDVEYKNRR